MEILDMTATFGRLEQAHLSLRPGLNLICAPNESGKSTWCCFIRDMLYGLPTRSRGMLADKNRFAPWSGSPMSGRMDVITGGRRYTAIRSTLHANAPMGEFSCVHTGTAEPVAGITGQNFGETILGIPREVFNRSALIGQNSLAVDQDAELERRIAALVTTGEEDVSFSETYARLKKQLNRRRHHRTGQIPALEQEIAARRSALEELEELTRQADASQRQLDLARQQRKELEEQRSLWQQIEYQEQLRAYRQAYQTAEEASRKAEWLAGTDSHLPDDATLSRLAGQCAACRAAQPQAVQAGQDADRAARDAAEAQTQYENHPLYPAAERELEERLREMGPPEKPAPVAAYALGAVLTIAACGAAWGLWRGHWPVFGVAAGIALLCAAALVFTSRSRRRQFARQLADANRRQAELEQEIDTYRALQRRAGESAAHAAQARTIAGHMARQQEEQLRAILSEVRQFQEAAVSLDGAEVALVQARQQRDALAAARQSARDAALRRDLLGSRLPRSEDMPAADAELPAPAMDLAQVEQLLPEAAVRVQTEQSQLDTLRGRIAALGSGEALSAEITQRQEELDRLQGEYDAIALAMETLEAANTTLQSRFSPALGERAAAYLSRITGGRYRKVLLDRSFALAAETEDDPIRRSIQLLSQGTADQVYLSLRLAICDMVLPQEASVPLILDDALTSFDDERLRGALEVLLEESRRRQILLFTCQRREAELLCGREGVFVTEL